VRETACHTVASQSFPCAQGRAALAEKPMDQLNAHQLWGLSPALDLLDVAAKAAQPQPVQPQQGSEAAVAPPVCILQVCGGVCVRVRASMHAFAALSVAPLALDPLEVTSLSLAAAPPCSWPPTTSGTPCSPCAGTRGMRVAPPCPMARRCTCTFTRRSQRAWHATSCCSACSWTAAACPRSAWRCSWSCTATRCSGSARPTTWVGEGKSGLAGRWLPAASGQLPAAGGIVTQSYQAKHPAGCEQA